MTDLAPRIEALLSRELSNWTLAANNYNALAGVKIRTLKVGNATVKLQFNPARIVSTSAKVDAKSVAARPCFLCESNRPPEQSGIELDKYTILVNPFPIFPRHFTIPAKTHTPQRIAGRIADMLTLTGQMPGYTVFYNGPRCGASAPDHMHFQAGNSDFLPLADNIANSPIRPLASFGKAQLSFVSNLPFAIFLIQSTDISDAATAFESLYSLLPPAEPEPMMNLLCYRVDNTLNLAVIPRHKHRPDCYGTDGSATLMFSPAAVDMGFASAMPREEDFNKITSAWLNDIYSELAESQATVSSILRYYDLKSKPKPTPTVQVGIMTANEILIDFGEYGYNAIGKQSFVFRNGAIDWDGKIAPEFTFVPKNGDKARFTLQNVKIGIGFHWEREENQTFAGGLSLTATDKGITVINTIDIEQYLKSVISSEMSATASLELLRTHAIISRSWLLAQIEASGSESAKTPTPDTPADEYIKWYDHENHTMFDVCADDHCQRYQGVGRETTATVAEAVDSTRGMVLTFDGKICDARFSKCCGGALEQFENCWQNQPHSYLIGKRDLLPQSALPDLTVEDNAREWILSAPESFCNTSDSAVLGQVLNNYDCETPDFYRWNQDYQQDELAELIAQRSGIDFGKIIALEPVERGTSGRIVRLRITGTRQSITVGKELEIRRWLSTSHLYSSAFIVEPWPTDSDGIPTGFTLKGAGWGHGVGLCQIGAAMMGEKGYDFRRILSHYFPGSLIEPIY